MMTQEALMATDIDDFNAWEISLEVGRFTLKYLSSDISENAYTLCGGEEANGFELWRNLQLQYGGGSKVVEIGGVRKFMDYPRCTSETGVVKHITGWEQLLTKYGSELRQTP